MTAIDRAEARFFPPQSPDEQKKADVEELRLLALQLGEGVERLVPDGRLKAASLTSLETALMQATRGVFAPVDVSQVQRIGERQSPEQLPVAGDPHYEFPQPHAGS